MKTNALPHYDDSINTTGCCPRFNAEGRDGQDLHFENKEFLRATTRSALHVPLKPGSVFSRIQGRIRAAKAYDPNNFVVSSRDLSPWEAEHLFPVSAEVPDEDAVKLTGDFVTEVFEGPCRSAKDWYGEIQATAREKGATTDEIYFFCTTCPKCAKAYGKTYVIGVARTG